VSESVRGDALAGRTVAFLVANLGVEQVELTDPWEAVRRAGGTPKLIAPSADPVQGFNHVEKGDTFPVDLTVAQADVADFAGLVLPGGVRNGDRLRMDAGAVALARAFFDAGKPVAAICHAHWTIIEADVVRGRRLTSWPSVATDLRNAGADWVDEEVVVDKSGPNTLITSRKPDDLPAFDEAFVAEFARG
jgi:protease I